MINPRCEPYFCQFSRGRSVLCSSATIRSLDSMSPTTLRCTVDGPVATITLARPDKMNAFNATMHAELRDALDQCERDDTVCVVVLTGEGRAFSSGQDLTVDLTRDAQ